MFLEKADFGRARPELSGIFFIEGAGHCSNVYLLDEGLGMVDAANVRGITNEVDEEFDISRLEYLFITHPHSDHVGGLMEMLRFCNPRVCVHQEAIPYVRLGEMSLAQALRHFDRDRLLMPLSGGERIALRSGRVLEVIATAGHSRGDICLFDRGSGSLFSGDTVIASDPDNAYLAAPDPVLGDMNRVVNSLALLFNYPVRHLFPGHGNPTLDDGGEHVKNALFHFLKQVEKREDMVWIRMGAALADAGRLEEAVGLYDLVLNTSPEHPEACVCKGMALLELSRFEEALSLFGAALSRQPGTEMALIGMGFALTGLGRKEEALEIEVFRRKAYPGLRPGKSSGGPD